jgi:hypothetical protein
MGSVTVNRCPRTSVRRGASSISLLDLFCPIPPAVNPAVEAAQVRLQNWVQAFGLVQGEAALQRFVEARFAWLLARTYPLADLDALEIVTLWNSWLFLFDDVNDESELSRKPAQLQSLHAKLLAILHGQVAPSSDDPFESSLADVWSKIASWATSDWKARFLAHVAEYFGACRWESRNRAMGRIPTVEQYIGKRALTGAMQTAFDLSYLSENITLPEVARDHPAILALAQACTNVVCFANDIYSCHKERMQHDYHNLVATLQHQGSLSLQAALEQAACLHNAEMRKFQALEQDLPGALARDQLSYDENLKRYVGVMRSWIAGNFSWSQETARYYQPRTQVTSGSSTRSHTSAE